MITVLFVGHGTRYEQGQREFHSMVAKTERLIRTTDPSVRVDFCFLELAQPDIQNALERCIAHGANRVLLVPLLLFAAGHLKQDIPCEVRPVSERHPHVTIEVLDAIGVDDTFAALAANRLREAGFTSSNPDVGVLILGRGNRDDQAQSEFERVAQKVRDCFQIEHMQTAFLAGSGTRLEVGFANLVRSGVSQVFVLPYLWFHGYLTEKLPGQIDLIKAKHADFVAVTVAHPLGPDDALAKVLATRVRAALGQNVVP